MKNKKNRDERRVEWFKGSLFALAMLLIPAAPIMAKAGGVALSATAEIETVTVDKNGAKKVERKEVSKESVYPGDVIVFTTTCANKAESPANGVVIKNPVSKDMVYIVNSAVGDGADITFSADNGKTFDVPEKLKVLKPDGKKRNAAPADYTHVRWSFSKPLGPGTVKTVSFKAKVK